MKQLTEQQIVENWDKFLNLVENNFTDVRKETLMKIVEHFQDRMMLAPASSKEHYHGAHPGGYIEHVLNVYNIAMDLFQVWQKYSDIIDYTLEEITLVTLFHDLGKMGDITEEFYFPQDNEWRRQNMGEIYKINDKIVNMNGADRSLYILQHFGIQLTQNEWITIKIHEGLYEESNSSYLKVMTENSILKSNLPHLMHQADVIATRIEYEQWKHIYRNEVSTLTQKPTSKKYTSKKNFSDIASDKTINPLANFFDTKQGIDAELSIDALFDDGKKEK
jgi:hypothetical protein